MDNIEKSSQAQTLDIYGEVLELRKSRTQMVFVIYLSKLSLKVVMGLGQKFLTRVRSGQVGLGLNLENFP